MTNYKIILEFDGTRYSGWQRLKDNDNTIQGKIEDCLLKMTESPVKITGCGRTDAGVHAREYVANFHLNKDIPAQYIKEYLNKYLPHDINVSSCEKADERFHSRLNVKQKTYVYRIWNSTEHNVFEHKYMYELNAKLDMEKMKAVAEILKGQHDFRGFCSNKNYKKSTVRTLYNILIENMGDEIRISYTGNGFLYNMVRILTGTLLDAGMGRIAEEDVKNIFDTGRRSDAGFTVPAKGLILTKVHY